MDIQHVKLLPAESPVRTVEMQQGVMLASFYDSIDKEMAKQSLKTLHSRMIDILKANLWMMGRTRKIKENNETYVHLELDPAFQNPADYIDSVKDDTVFKAFATRSNKKIGDSLWKYNIKKGKETLGVHGDPKKPGKKLVNFAIIQSSDKAKMCLTLSVNHTIGDGATIYNIWKMLDANEDIFSLNRGKIENYEEHVNRAVSVISSREGVRKTFADEQKEAGKYMMPALMMNGVGNMFTMVKRGIYTYKLNSSYLEAEKAKYTDATSFVSTNDVIASSFMNSLGPHSNNMYLAINLRGRVPEIAADRAGNYLAAPQFKTEHFSTPKHVRKHLEDVLRPDFHWDSPTYSELRKFGGAVNTSWARFYHHLEPLGFKQVMHMPVFRDMGWQIGPLYLSIAAVIIIYRSNKDELSAWFGLNDGNIDMKKFLKHEMLAERMFGP